MNLFKSPPPFLKVTNKNKEAARKLTAAREATAAAIKAVANAKAAENKARVNAKAAENKARDQANALRKLQETMVNRNAEFKKLIAAHNAAWNAILKSKMKSNERIALLKKHKHIVNRNKIVAQLGRANRTASMNSELRAIAKHINLHLGNYHVIKGANITKKPTVSPYTPWRAIIAHNMNEKRRAEAAKAGPSPSTYVPRLSRPPYHGSQIPGVKNTANIGRFVNIIEKTPRLKNESNNAHFARIMKKLDNVRRKTPV
jgi:hypothetical protein